MSNSNIKPNEISCSVKWRKLMLFYLTPLTIFYIFVKKIANVFQRTQEPGDYKPKQHVIQCVQHSAHEYLNEKSC